MLFSSQLGASFASRWVFTPLASIILALEHQQDSNNARALNFYWLLLFFTVAEGACID